MQNTALLILCPSFLAFNGVTFFLYEKIPHVQIQGISKRNNNTAITQPLTNAVLNQWLACCGLIEMPPRNKQCQQNRRNNSYFSSENRFQVLVFSARAFYLGLIWVYRVLAIFLWSLAHLMPLLASAPRGTAKGSFSSIVTVAFSFLLFFSCFFFDS